MKKSFLVLTLLLGSAGACSRVEEEVVSSFFRSYLRAQQALASDDLATTVQAFDSFVETGNSPVNESVQSLQEATDLEGARVRFKELSDQIVKMEIPDGLVVVHCPMAAEGEGASWVQQDGDIANPYFGPAMKECGEIQRN